MYIFCEAGGGAGVIKSLKCMMRVSAEIQVYLKKKGVQFVDI